MTTTPKLTDQDVENLIDCAGTGIGYWANSGHLDKAAKTYRVIEADHELAAGEAPTDKTLSYDDIRQAFAVLAVDGKLPDWQMREIAENDLAFDATVGDVVVQQAMFGKLIYG